VNSKVNQIILFRTMATFTLPLKDMDCISRMYEIQKRIEKMKKSSFPVISSLLHSIGGFFPRWLGLSVYYFIGWTSSFLRFAVISNFAVPRFKNFIGYPVSTLFATSGIIVGTNGIHIFPSSCNGYLAVGIIGDIKVLKSKEKAARIVESIHYQFQNILNISTEKIFMENNKIK
jgi:succinate dehydrogenase/fumarate reductase cytochrome b subunit